MMTDDVYAIAVSLQKALFQAVSSENDKSEEHLFCNIFNKAVRSCDNPNHNIQCNTFLQYFE